MIYIFTQCYHTIKIPLLAHPLCSPLCLCIPLINIAVCVFSSDPGPKCVLPRHPAGDRPRHPVLLGCPHGDDGPQTDWQAAFQRGETNHNCPNRSLAQQDVMCGSSGGHG